MLFTSVEAAGGGGGQGQGGGRSVASQARGEPRGGWARESY